MKNVIEFIIKAIDQASPEFKDVANEAGKSAKKIEYDYTALSLASTAAFGALAFGIKDATGESTELSNALLGLSSIAEGNEISVTKAKDAAIALTNDGLMGVADAATSLKNLIGRGFGLEESVDIMNRFKDSAAFGRQASLSFGESIKGATEGLKNENSVLVDNAGVTKNVSKMWEDYAKAHGKSVKDLTQAEKLQAEYNGIMEETRFQVGDAAKLASEFSGQLSKVSAETKMAKAALGESLQPSLSDMLATLSPVISGLKDWIKTNPELASSLTLASTALAGTVALVTGLGALLPSIKAGFLALTGPIGLAAVALGGLAAGYVAYKTKVDGAIQAQERQIQTLIEGARKSYEQAQEVDNLSTRLDNLMKSTDDAEVKQEELHDILENVRDLAPAVAAKFDLLESSLLNNKDAAAQLRTELRKLNAQMLEDAKIQADVAKAKLPALREEHEKWTKQLAEADAAMTDPLEMIKQYGSRVEYVGAAYSSASQQQKKAGEILGEISQKYKEARDAVTNSELALKQYDAYVKGATETIEDNTKKVKENTEALGGSGGSGGKGSSKSHTQAVKEDKEAMDIAEQQLIKFRSAFIASTAAIGENTESQAYLTTQHQYLNDSLAVVHQRVEGLVEQIKQKSQDENVDAEIIKVLLEQYDSWIAKEKDLQEQLQKTNEQLKKQIDQKITLADLGGSKSKGKVKELANVIGLQAIYDQKGTITSDDLNKLPKHHTGKVPGNTSREYPALIRDDEWIIPDRDVKRVPATGMGGITFVLQFNQPVYGLADFERQIRNILERMDIASLFHRQLVRAGVRV